MSVHHNRESARTSDPAYLATLVATIRQNLNHSRRQRFHELTTPINAAEAFAVAEQQAEDERFR